MYSYSMNWDDWGEDEIENFLKKKEIELMLEEMSNSCWNLEPIEKKSKGKKKLVKKQPEPESEFEIKEEFISLYKQAYMTLINGALDNKNQELFVKLTDEYNRLFGASV